MGLPDIWIVHKLFGLYFALMNYGPLYAFTNPMFDVMAGLIGAVPTHTSSTIPSGATKSIIEINQDSANDWERVNDNVMGGISTSSFSVKQEDSTWFIDYKGKINTHGGGFTTL